MRPPDYNPNLNKVERVLHRELGIYIPLGLIFVLSGAFQLAAGRIAGWMWMLPGLALLGFALGRFIGRRIKEKN